MKLLTKAQERQLLANGAQRHKKGFDPKPVVKLFNPTGSATWLLTELDPQNPDIAFGLCDLGFGTPELGSVSLNELRQVRGQFGLGIEREIYFSADKTISEYATAARKIGHIDA